MKDCLNIKFVNFTFKLLQDYEISEKSSKKVSDRLKKLEYLSQKPIKRVRPAAPEKPFENSHSEMKPVSSFNHSNSHALHPNKSANPKEKSLNSSMIAADSNSYE